MLMPFGKYEGRAISELPDGYIKWCMENLENIDDDLMWELSDEFMKRTTKKARQERAQGNSDSRPVSGLPVAVSVDLALEIVKAGRRALAVQYHPDRSSGNSERMVQANATADYLEKRIPLMLAGRN